MRAAYPFLVTERVHRAFLFFEARLSSALKSLEILEIIKSRARYKKPIRQFWVILGRI
jgi:hypothetical protein